MSEFTIKPASRQAVKPLFDLTGQKFGRLFVKQFHGRTGNYWYWECVCECGKTKTVRGDHLRGGRIVSCGCYSSERSSIENSTHGDSRRKTKKAKEFVVWSGIRQRCHNSKAPNFFRYGGRGIAVCSRWRESYENFLADMGRAPSAEHTIERKNNEGNYCPENCIWATRKAQANNRRTNHFLTFDGQTLTAGQWAEKTGIDSMTILARIKRGWSERKSLTTPIHQ